MGHIKIAKTFGAICVLTPLSPHKNETGVSFVDRCEMLRLCGLEVCEIEASIAPPNYTYKTIEKLGKCRFIIGFDQFAAIETWARAQYLKEMLYFIVVPRNMTDAGFTPNSTGAAVNEEDFANLKEKGYNFEIVNFERVNITSTQIREALKIGANIDNLVTKEVKNYIQRQKLYS